LRAAFPSVIPLAAEFAILGAEIRSENKLALADSLIIATALLEKSDLLTFDKSMKAAYERIK
jgi:predicted nucleic acid-binding protein